jgi:hypothetical protein
MKHFFKKMLKSIIRNPYQVVLILAIVACMIYTFDLYVHSKVVARMTSPTMGFWTFIITLLAFLGPVTYLFYMDKKKLIMLIVYEAMAFGALAISVYYLARIQYELNQGLLPMDENIYQSWNNVTVAIVFWALGILASFVAIIFDRLHKKRKGLSMIHEKK